MKSGFMTSQSIKVGRDVVRIGIKKVTGRIQSLSRRGGLPNPLICEARFRFSLSAARKITSYLCRHKLPRRAKLHASVALSILMSLLVTQTLLSH